MEARWEDEISRRVIGAAFTVHSALGPGLLESAYEACLEHELSGRGMRVARQETVVVELKAVERLQPVHVAQALTYLRLTGKKLCLLLNFNTLHLRHGIQRIVNRL